jgi:Zn finger protein HypA/HybF involved in hydrogenase expression
MINRLGFVFRRLRSLFDALVDPLRKDPDANQFRLSIPEAQTTTVDGDVGWSRRPPARLRCPRCEATIEHHDPRADIDCPRCVAEFSHEEFPELELLCLVCPTCGDRMEHGQRHPNRFDIPEWATCHTCRYHWDFKHSY